MLAQGLVKVLSTFGDVCLIKLQMQWKKKKSIILCVYTKDISVNFVYLNFSLIWTLFIGQLTKEVQIGKEDRYTVWFQRTTVLSSHKHTHTYNIMWNLSTADTIGTAKTLLISEVSILFQG